MKPDKNHILKAQWQSADGMVKFRINAESMNRFFTKEQLKKHPEMQYFNQEDGREWITPQMRRAKNIPEPNDALYPIDQVSSTQNSRRTKQVLGALT
jgi:hypothetical protein